MPRGRRRDVLRPALTRRFTAEELTRYANEYLFDFDPGAAAERCGWLRDYGPLLLARPEVQQRIKVNRFRQATQTEIYTDAVVARWWQLATADARELTAVHRVNCRHCHGLDHRYQFTIDELRTARQAHEVRQLEISDEHARVPFDDLGGDGFDVWGEPDPGCTECGGKGLPQVWVADTRHLSPAAALLYDGVEVNAREGTLRVKMRDRGWADQMVANHLGIAVRGNRDGPTPVDPRRMSDEQLEATIERFRLMGVIDGESGEEGPGQPQLEEAEGA